MDRERFLRSLRGMEPGDRVLTDQPSWPPSGSDALNAGRWDYIFSAIKTFLERPDALLPDRAEVKMSDDS